MKAAQYSEFRGEIKVVDLPLPELPEDGVIIQVKATGVCRSDWHGWCGHDGDIRDHGLPFTPGHELSGIVTRVGKDVAAFAEGDRVAVPFILSCGNCCECVQGMRTVCRRQVVSLTRNPLPVGLYNLAIYIAATWVYYARVFCGICGSSSCRYKPVEASLGSLFRASCRSGVQVRALAGALGYKLVTMVMDRFTTAYRAVVQQGEVKAGEFVGVFGCGGVGLSCVSVWSETLKR